MDLSKVERQAPAEGQGSEPPNYMKILLQDMICFFVLLSLALLVVAGILYVADDVTRLHHRPRDSVNGSRAVSVEDASKHMHMHRYLRPDTWLRLFMCQKQQDTRMVQQHERNQRHEQELKGEGQRLKETVEQEEMDEHQPFGPYVDSTYEPNNHPEHNQLQAGGDHV
ncbi:hypothetical protein KR059_005902, partial [Drosophila kikkawai]